MTVSIPIHEGLQYRLKEIQWSGNSVMPTADLSKNIHLKVGEAANGVQLREDLNSIRSLYGRRGYIMAAIRPDPNFQDEMQTVAYRLEVQEGDLYRMGKFEVRGVDPSLAETLQKLFRPQTGEPFDAEFQKPYFLEMARYLPKNLLAGNVNFRITPNLGAKTVDVTLSFAPRSSP
ncbi:MAG TPA: POTRA domain-containing protein [Terriglobia bacterium]|nr:POTRA domain-containing protein [Terriglobia bacterium]